MAAQGSTMGSSNKGTCPLPVLHWNARQTKRIFLTSPVRRIGFFKPHLWIASPPYCRTGDEFLHTSSHVLFPLCLTQTVPLSHPLPSRRHNCRDPGPFSLCPLCAGQPTHMRTASQQAAPLSDSTRVPWVSKVPTTYEPGPGRGRLASHNPTDTYDGGAGVGGGPPERLTGLTHPTAGPSIGSPPAPCPGNCCIPRQLHHRPSIFFVLPASGALSLPRSPAVARHIPRPPVYSCLSDGTSDRCTVLSITRVVVVVEVVAATHHRCRIQ
ncbi:hypothetical protein IWZ01DRAFT_209812 [Phyllosticta capitalensis]